MSFHDMAAEGPMTMLAKIGDNVQRNVETKEVGWGEGRRMRGEGGGGGST
jgi:hypothetical protein